MALSDYLLKLDPVLALGIAFAVALVATLVAMPILIRKLKGAGIIGRDVNKEGRPEVAEMGGLGVVFGFYTGIFAFLMLHATDVQQHVLILVSLITAAGATITGIVDDLISLQQRFKAFVPLVFAAPLAVYVSDYTIAFPLLGTVNLGLFYPLVIVPIAVTSGANAYNMLEGFNGLGTGLGIVIASTLAILAYLSGNLTGLILLGPLIGALLAFLVFNKYPAKAFPGDTLTLFLGAVLVTAAIVSKIEFWGGLLFLPHIIEFGIKAKNKFPTRGWWGEVRGKKLYCPPHGPVGLGQVVMKLTGGVRESHLSLILVGVQVLLAAAVIGMFAATTL